MNGGRYTDQQDQRAQRRDDPAQPSATPRRARAPRSSSQHATGDENAPNLEKHPGSDRHRTFDHHHRRPHLLPKLQGTVASPTKQCAERHIEGTPRNASISAQSERRTPITHRCDEALFGSSAKTGVSNRHMTHAERGCTMMRSLCPGGAAHQSGPGTRCWHKADKDAALLGCCGRSRPHLTLNATGGESRVVRSPRLTVVRYAPGPRSAAPSSWPSWALPRSLRSRAPATSAISPPWEPARFSPTSSARPASAAPKPPTQISTGPASSFVRLRKGVSPVTGLADMHRLADLSEKDFASDPNAMGDTVHVLDVQHPLEIVNYQSTGVTPVILAADLAGGAIVPVALTLISSVRRSCARGVADGTGDTGATEHQRLPRARRCRLLDLTFLG